MANGDIGILITRNGGQYKVSEHMWALTPADEIPYLDCLWPTFWEIWKIKIAFILLHGIAKNQIEHRTFIRRS